MDIIKTQAGVAYAVWSKRQEYFKYGCVFYSSCDCGLKFIHVYRYIGQYTAEVFWLNNCIAVSVGQKLAKLVVYNDG